VMSVICMFTLINDHVVPLRIHHIIINLSACCACTGVNVQEAQLSLRDSAMCRVS